MATILYSSIVADSTIGHLVCTRGAPVAWMLAIAMVAARGQVPDALRIPTPPTVAQPASAPGPLLQASTFNLTVGAVTPFAVTLNWDGQSNATGYAVLKNGLAIAQLPATARSYQDTAVLPASRHRYQVEAQVEQSRFRTILNALAGAGPPSTAMLEIDLPSVLPPEGFSLRMVGPDTVEISWRPRPGASGYALFRNGSRVSMGPQPRPNVYTEHNVRPGATTYAMRTVYVRPDGQELLSDATAVLSLRAGPFRVLAIGDSVMWGQGLRDRSKFKTKVGDWIAGQLGRPVVVTLLARSGAIVGQPPGPAPAAQSGPPHGEVPSSTPTVQNQGLVLGPQRLTTSDVDLLLVDGCINDLNVRSILSPQMNATQIASETARLCNEPVRSLLVSLAAVYPSSKILLIGYFPIVSGNSDLRALTFFAAQVGALTPAIAAAAGLPFDPLTGVIAGTAAAEHYRQHVIANSDAFHAISTSSLLSAAITANTQSTGNRIEFVPVPFGVNNAYAAPDSYLWLVPTHPVQQDEVYAERYRSCRPLAGADKLLCIEASMGHPNVRGAQAYADSITARFDKYLPEWRARFSSAQPTN